MKYDEYREQFKPSHEYINAGRRFKEALKKGEIFATVGGERKRVVSHGFRYGVRFIKTEGKEEKIYEFEICDGKDYYIDHDLRLDYVVAGLDVV